MSTVPSRMYPLDVLRGLAALCVVFWHWQHFFYVADVPTSLMVERQPLFELLPVLYRHGGLAVQLFFCISGFVFFWLFARVIASRRLTLRDYCSDRFSRLYPLHLLSFLLVAGLQAIYLSGHGSYFVYPFNDAWHALLNLLLIPAWGLEKGWSFNAPIWSVSIEIILYGLFFALCRLRLPLAPAAAVLAVAGYQLLATHYMLGSGLLAFFAGGLAYLLMQQMQMRLGNWPALLLAGLLMLGAWAGVCQREPLDLYLIMGLAFPASVLFVASISAVWPQGMRSLGWLGDLSYSSYLLHFPLQIIFALVADGLGYMRDVFYGLPAMLLFFALLLPVSLASHRMLERPMQIWLRQRLKR